MCPNCNATLPDNAGGPQPPSEALQHPLTLFKWLKEAGVTVWGVACMLAVLRCLCVCLCLQKQKKVARKKRDAAEAKAEEMGLEPPARKQQKVRGLWVV